MMKHRILSLVCMLLALCMACTSALAAGGSVAIIGGSSGATTINSIFTNSDDGYFYVENMAATSDTLYALASTDNGLRLAMWRSDMEEPLLLGGDEEGNSTLINASWYSSMDELEGVIGDSNHAISAIFTDGEKLMGINNLNGRVYEIGIDGDQLVYTDVVTLKDTKPLTHQEEDYTYAISLSSTAVLDGKLYFTTNDYSNEGWPIYKLYIADLTDGTVTESKVEFINIVSPYKDGKLLVKVHDQQNAWDVDTQTYKNPELAVYDPKTDTTELLAEFTTSNVDAMAYCASLDAVIYMDTSRIMGIDSQGVARQYGYAPVSYANRLAIMGDSAVISNYDSTLIRTLTADFRTDEYLNISGSWMDDGARLFSSRYPDVPLYYSNEYYSDVEGLSQAMVSGDNSVDVISLDVEYSSFNILMEKGYCADLSGYPELVAAVERMHPVLRDAVMRDGKLYAIPTQVNSWGWFYSPDVLEEVGLTEEDLPTNFVDLCDFVTTWNDEYLDEYPNYSLFDWVSNTKEYMFRWMMEAYLGWFTARGEDVTFDTPEFRALMDALDQMVCEDMDKVFSDEMNSDVYREGLLMNGYQVVGDFSWMDDSDRWQKFIPMTLTADTPFSVGVDMQVMFINPRTSHMDSAVQLLMCELEALDDTAKHLMYADETEPVLNTEYDRMLESEQEYLESLRKSLEEADEADRKELESYIESEEQYINETLPRYRYTISQEQIDYYQTNLVPVMYVAQPTFMSGTRDNASSELTTLMNRYREGQIGLDQFIREADNKMRMMRMENE